MKSLPWASLAVGLALVGGAWYVLRRLGNVAGAAQAAAQAAAQQTGERVSQAVWDFTNPEFSAESFNRPTIVDPLLVDGRYTCPPGYRYKFTDRGAHICLRID